LKASFFFTIFILFFIGFLFCFSGSFSLDEIYSIEEVEKVLGLIVQIQQDQLEPNQCELREVAVTESELNSYIAYRIDHEGAAP